MKARSTIRRELRDAEKIERDTAYEDAPFDMTALDGVRQALAWVLGEPVSRPTVAFRPKPQERP